MSKNVSNEFKNIIKSGGPFYPYIKMTLSDGTELNLTADNDFLVDGDTGYSEGSESGFPLGAAISKKITFLVNNNPDQEYDYYYARLTLYTEADLLSGATESIQEGMFTIIDSVKPGDTLEITAYDDMYKSDVNFTSSLTYPVSAQQLLDEVCDFCDITLGSVTFPNNNFQIKQAPEGLTGRQLIGYIAQIAGGNAVIDRTGRLIIKTYNMSGFDSQEAVTAGEIETASGIHIISEYTEYPDIGTDNVAITGVSVTIPAKDSGSDDEVYVSGTEDYAISIDNPLIVGQEKYAANLIAAAVVGVYARPFTGSFLPDPTIEFMDLAYLVDTKDKVYKTYITRHNFVYLGNSTIENAMESPEKHGGSYYSNASDVYQKAKNEIKINKTQWEQAIEHLTEQVANASGLYTTEEVQDDGSIIYYMHNKPTLEESDMVWKMTAETITVSTDGGKTWNAGITINGEVIAKIINTIAIDFDRGVGGTLILQTPSGEQTVYMDANTGAVRLSVESLTITGKTVNDIAEEIAGEKAESSINDFVDAVYDPAISNLQAQIDGQVETWFYDYVPTTSNAPANQWTTDTEKDKHLGDLFYVVDNPDHGGEAYRWAKINNEYTWDYVEDTAVVKALADAADAKDIADQKRRVFTSTPYPPYDVGDLWVGDDTSDLMRCQTARGSGNFNSSDWIKAVKYTDNSDLYDFISEEYQETIDDLQEQSDQKAETWYQAVDPSSGWSETEKQKHSGDLWYNTSTQKTYIYNGSAWEETKSNPPDDVFDQIDGKAQIFINQPSPPYSVGDLWFNSSTSDIMTCIVSRQSGVYTASDWEKRNKYTDDSKANEVDENLNIFADSVTEEINSMQTQIDGKIETFYYDYEPTLNNIPASAWTTKEERQKHIGDLFYWKSKGFTYRFLNDGSTWKWQAIKDSDIDEALNQAAAAQDTADGKRRVFTTTPVPPYDVGDLWAQGSSGDIMRCKNARTSGENYVSTDWEPASKYTDDSAVDDLDEALNQQGIFNRLTNNGLSQGIFLKNGQLYLNGEYMEFNGATIGGWLVSGNQLRNDQTNFEVKIQAPTVYGPSGLSTADIIAVHDKRKNTWPFVVTSDGSMDLGDEFQYRPNGFAYDSTVQMNVGGWQIKKAQNVWGYNEVIYWDTIETQTNGIGAKGPWVIWGGWNGRSSLDYVNNYKFVVSDQGNVYGQRFYDNGQQLLPIVVEVTHKILTNDYCYVGKSGYYLLACYLIRPVDHSIYVKAIQYRNDNTYTVALQGTNGGEIDLYTMWAKMPD